MLVSDKLKLISKSIMFNQFLDIVVHCAILWCAAWRFLETEE